MSYRITCSSGFSGVVLGSLTLVTALVLGLIALKVVSRSEASATTDSESAKTQGPTRSEQPVARPEPTPVGENTTLVKKTPQYLCDHLADLKEMAWDPKDHSGDAVYDGLKRNGYYSIPCLIEKITDTRPAENPTGAPFMAGLTYRVGDTAVNMLMDINEMYWPKGMMPEKYEHMFKTEGMFSYYYYVHEDPNARKQVQHWWRNWMKTCQPECTIVPSIGK